MLGEGVQVDVEDVASVTAVVTGTTGASTPATTFSWAGVTRSYVRSASKLLWPVLFWITASGMPASNRVVVPVAHRLWLVKLPLGMVSAPGRVEFLVLIHVLKTPVAQALLFFICFGTNGVYICAVLANSIAYQRGGKPGHGRYRHALRRHRRVERRQ